ncbi:e9imm peptide [Kitasatospora sp. NBC_01246]|uniref:e9imm peptide n=1 Tax=Kitasatospora sp. NBC_01246 TaxID=2903570 RepID=UPI002E3122AA|nr:e9imm peptide [Kitasatospora sp. NBC_01246]
MDADCADDAEPCGVLVALGKALGCPSGYGSDLIFWPEGRQPTAPEVVGQALGYRPFALWEGPEPAAGRPATVCRTVRRRG